MIKCCIFDLDGTVLDTLGTITYYVNVALERFGIRTISEEECKYFVGEGARVLISRALKSRGVYTDELAREVYDFYDRAYKSCPSYLTKPFDGISEMLTSLKERGIKLALLSNKQHNVTYDAIEYFFPGIFDTVAGGKEGVPLKPDPTAALSIMKELSVDAENVAYIGDTSTDMKTGKNINAKLTIGVCWGFRDKDELWANGADRVVSEVFDIYREVVSVD